MAARGLIVVTAGLAGALLVAPVAPAQDLLPTPEGRLGGREPLETPELVAPVPTSPPATASPAPTVPPRPIDAVATPGGAETMVGEVEPGALATVRRATVTVLALRGDAAVVGSGWFFDDAGRIVTAEPVVAGADRIEVVAADGRRQSAHLLGADPFSGVAVLEVRDLQAPVADPGAPPAIGDEVVAVGTAEGRFPGSLAAGIVAATTRSLPDMYPATALIQVDARLAPGLAGGPLASPADDRVVGLVVPSTRSDAGPPLPELPELPDLPDLPDLPQIPDLPGGDQGAVEALPTGDPGLAFAVPMDTVQRVAAELIDRGRVDYPFLGAALAEVTPAEASRQALPVVAGVVVAEVVPEGPAAAAGLEVGDVIVALDGTAVGPNAPFLPALLARQPGETVELEILRRDAQQTVNVTLGERPVTATDARVG